MNWLKFGGLVSFAFVLGLLFAGLLDLPRNTLAQGGDPSPATLTQARPANRAIPGTQPLEQLSEAYAAVAEAVRPSVVFITSQRTQQAQERRLPPGFEQFFPRQPFGGPRIERGQGSGFIVSRDGYVLTNSHVVEGADRVTVELLDRRSFNAKVVGTDPLTDVAVVKIDARNLNPAVLGTSEDVRVGEWVLAVGNPLGDNLTFTVTSGIVSAKGRGRLGLPNNRSQSAIQDFIQTDAAINPGNSGGPLLNIRGEVIGINSAIASQTGTYVGYGFAIPIDLAKHVMQQLIDNGQVQRAALGVLVNDATAEDADYVGLPEIRGVRVSSFPEDSPARRAGIQEGDIIISVEGQPVEYTAQLQQVVGFRKPGETVKVEVARKGGERRSYDVRLTAQSRTEQLARAEPRSEDETGGAEGASIQQLGLTVEPVTPQWADQLQLDAGTRGLVVRSVSPDGPAAELVSSAADGSPDIITAVEGKPVRTVAELRSALRGAGYGGVVTLTVLNPGLNDFPSGRRIVRLRVQ